MSSQSLPHLAKFAAVCGICLYLPLLAVVASPAHAQGPLPTPTPYPAIEATRQAAQAQLEQANAQQAQAAQMDAQAAEMRRNAEAQQASASRALSDARAALVAQNVAAYAEALGRAESDLAQLRGTVDGLSQLNATAGDTVRSQAQTIVSMTLEAQTLRTSNATLSAAYAATAQRAAEAEQVAEQGSASPVLLLVIAFLIFMLGVGLIAIVQRKQGGVIAQAPPIAYDVGEYAEVIDNDSDHNHH